VLGHPLQVTLRDRWQHPTYRTCITEAVCDAERVQSFDGAVEDRAGIVAGCNAEGAGRFTGVEQVAVGVLVEPGVDTTQQPRGTRPEHRQPEPFHIVGSGGESDGFDGCIEPGDDADARARFGHAVVCARRRPSGTMNDGCSPTIRMQLQGSRWFSRRRTGSPC